jgi:hypothetical protein
MIFLRNKVIPLPHDQKDLKPRAWNFNDSMLFEGD